MKKTWFVILTAGFFFSSQSFAMSGQEFDGLYGVPALNYINSNSKNMTYAVCDSLDHTRDYYQFKCADMNDCFQGLYKWIYGPGISNCMTDPEPTGKDKARELFEYTKGYFSLRNQLLQKF